MVNLLKTPGRWFGTLLAAGFLMAAQSYAAPERIARPGTINYVEGQVTVNGQSVTSQQLGSLEVAPGEVLETGNNAKAEMLLTPGTFLRLGDNSAVRMVSPSLTDTQVELVKGRAMVEADLVEKENRLDIVDNGVNTVLEKKGIYEFNANQPLVAVYDGKAQVRVDDHTVDVGKGKELQLAQTTGKLKPQKFDRNDTDNLYAWSKLRSEYTAQANASSAQMIVAANPYWWYGTGWYWNPYFDSWAFVPGAGFLYSPFGFGFYSPLYYSSFVPYYPGFYRGGVINRGVVTHRGFGAPALRTSPGPSFRGFSGGARGFAGGGGAHIGGIGRR